MTIDFIGNQDREAERDKNGLCQPSDAVQLVRNVVKKGVNSGKEFWSCSGYPECNGTRRIS